MQWRAKVWSEWSEPGHALSFGTGKKQSTPAIAQVTKAPTGPTYPAAGVIATRPATIPEQIPRRLGLPLTSHSVSAHATPAVAVPNNVLKNAIPAPPVASKAGPPLKPNQPTHS